MGDGPDDGLTGLGRRSALALVGAAVSGVATIATLIIASRTLTGPGAGEFFVAISLFAIVQGLCSFGVETGLQYFVPTMSEHDARRLTWIVCAASAAIGLVVAATVWVLAGPFGELLGEGEAGGGDTVHVVRTIAVLLPFAGLYEVTLGAVRARDQVLAATVLDGILRPSAQVIAMLVAALLSAGSQGAVLAWAVPNAVTVILAMLLLTRTSGRNLAQHTQIVSQRQFWLYTAPRSVARVAQTLTQRLDVLILAAVYSLEEAAVYGIVSRCMIAGVFIASALRQTVQPQLRRLIVGGDRAAVKNMYGASTTWLLIVTWPVYLAMITHAPLVMSVFGTEYTRGAPALVLLCLAMLVASGCGLVDVVLLMLGRSWLSTIDVLTALLLNIVLNLTLAPSFGMIGSAIAWVVAILATNLLPLLQIARVGLHPGGAPLATAMMLSVMCIAAPLALTRAVFGTTLVPFLIACTVALIAYAIALAHFRRTLKLDRMVSDLRRGRRVAAAG